MTTIAQITEMTQMTEITHKKFNARVIFKTLAEARVRAKSLDAPLIRFQA